MKFRLLSSKDVQRALPMRECIEFMKATFEQISIGTSTVPPAEPNSYSNS